MLDTVLKAAKSIQKLEDRLYMMEYEGEDGLNAFLNSGGAANPAEMKTFLMEFFFAGASKANPNIQTGDFGCSAISARNHKQEQIFGRNYDWNDDCTGLIVHMIPKDGYASISTACLNFLGYEPEYRPEGEVNQMKAIPAIYLPLDGMNEKGLVIADLVAGDEEVTNQDKGLPKVTGTLSTRLLLNRAANVDEAIALLKQYDMHSDIGIAHHFAIADASGKAVVVEYVDNEMIVTETKVVTNHYIGESKKKGVGSGQSFERFDILTDEIRMHENCMTPDDIRTALQKVAQSAFPGSESRTMWSIVYNQEEKTALFYYKEQYGNAYELKVSSMK